MRQDRRRRRWATTTRTATRRSTTRWCAWRRTSPCATRWSTARATSATSTAITPPPRATPRARLTDGRRLLLEGIDEDTVDFRPTYDGARQEPVGPAGQLPQPARQRLLRHRRRHGDQHPAAQRRRAVHRAPASHQASERHHREAGRVRAGPGLPHRRRHRRAARRRSWRPTRPAAAASACAPGGRRRTPDAAPTRSSSPRSPTRCRRPSWSSASPS